MVQVFVSHSTKDREFVEREILRALSAGGLQAWYAKESIHTSEMWERAILRGLRDSDWFLVVLSQDSARSTWVKREVDWAFVNRASRIIPVLLNECDADDFHLGMAGIQHVDYRGDPVSARARLLSMFGQAALSRTTGLPITVQGVKDCRDPEVLAALDLYERRIPAHARFEAPDIVRWLREDQLAVRRASPGNETILSWRNRTWRCAGSRWFIGSPKSATRSSPILSPTED